MTHLEQRFVWVVGVYSENVVNTAPEQTCQDMRPIENVHFILWGKSKAAV